MTASASIEFVEVGPRDGLQNEKLLVSTANKLALISRAIEAGARRIEVTSFVNPKKVPQMADAEDVCAALPARSDVTYIGLVMNMRGAERAMATGRINQLGAVVVSTDSFAMANQGQTSAESVSVAADIIKRANASGLTAQATIAASFGCPFEGEVAEDRVIEIAKRLADAWPVEIALADTIGVANPAHVSRLVEQVREAISPLPVRVHFHNTRNTGLANVWAAVLAGAKYCRCVARRSRRLSVRAGRGWQCAKRGCGLHARTCRHRHWHESGKTDRRQQLAIGRYGTETAGNGGAIAALPESSLRRK